MATMTHCDPVHVPPYATATNLCMRLARSLFEQAMTASAITDPNDAFYKAWWIMRQTAEKFTENRSLELTEKERLEFNAALYAAHRTAHMCADTPPFWRECDCETARIVSSVHQLLAGQPGRRRG